jgi:hypothetical protein
MLIAGEGEEEAELNNRELGSDQLSFAGSDRPDRESSAGRYFPTTCDKITVNPKISGHIFLLAQHHTASIALKRWEPDTRERLQCQAHN